MYLAQTVNNTKVEKPELGVLTLQLTQWVCVDYRAVLSLQFLLVW